MSETGSTPIAREKAALRNEARRRRASLGEAVRAAASEAVCARVLSACRISPGRVVSAYWPMGDELDPRSLMRRLCERGSVIGLPVMPGRARPLVFRAWVPGMALVPGGFGTSVPPEDQKAVNPDIYLVPLLAFDRTGYRLGYGGGFYDRTLAEARARRAILAIGLAFAAQEAASVPHEETDVRLDMIVTEQETIQIA